MKGRDLAIVIGAVGVAGVMGLTVLVGLVVFVQQRSRDRQAWAEELARGDYREEGLGPVDRQRPAPDARVERVMTAAMEAYPDLVARFGPLTYAQGYDEGARLTRRGLPRVGDADLLSQARIRLSMLESSDEVCTAMSSRPDVTVVMGAIGRLSDPDLREWARISARAAHLENLGGPRPITETQMDGAIRAGFESVGNRLTGEERVRWDALNWEALGDADACFLERVVHRETTRMPASEGARFLRGLCEANAVDPG